MARAFRRTRDGLVAQLDAEERAVLTSLAEQVLALIAPDGSEESEDEGGPADPFDAIVAGIGTLSTDTGAPAPERSSGLEARDPALDRLFPAGHREDPAEAEEFRRLTEPGLRRRKADNLETLVSVLSRRSANPADPDEIVLDERAAGTVLVALTDVRLVMGERLGLRTDDDAERLERAVDELDRDDPAIFAIALYDFLTWLQETLGQALIDPR